MRASANLALGLKQTITGEGVWRIRRRERSPMIEIFKNEESGYGDILSREFIQWRTQGSVNGGEDVEAAKARLLESINK